MAENTNIEWCDATFNPWEGCQKVGPGCDHCYAETRNARFGGGTAPNWGPGAPRRRTSPGNWRKPLLWNTQAFNECPACGWRGDGGADGLACPYIDCSGKLVPARRRIFCSSLADVFDNEVDPQWRADLFDLIRRTPNLDWLLLTKRIGNVRKMLEAAAQATVGTGSLNLWLTQWAFGTRAPANVWLGATIVNQEEADRDIPKLLATPARVRFLSMEPLLGPVTLREEWLLGAFDHCAEEDADPDIDGCRGCPGHGRECHAVRGPRLHWVIAGGESGHGARPMHPAWSRSLCDQCAAAGVPFLFKQHGEWVSAGERAFGTAPSREVLLLRPDGTVCDPKSAEGQDENADVTTMARVGKKAAGRLLDGVTHNGFPEVHR